MDRSTQQVTSEQGCTDWLADALAFLPTLGLRSSMVKAATDFLARLCETPSIPRPYIYPTPSGGVQFEWESDEQYFEMELVSDRVAVYLYRDDAAGVEEEGDVCRADMVARTAKYLKRFRLKNQ
jgi:hypothetical protein